LDYLLAWALSRVYVKSSGIQSLVWVQILYSGSCSALAYNVCVRISAVVELRFEVWKFEFSLKFVLMLMLGLGLRGGSILVFKISSLC
jgi:hypothetical protein